MKPRLCAVRLAVVLACGARVADARPVLAAAREKPVGATEISPAVMIAEAEWSAALLAETNRVRRAHGRYPLKPLDAAVAAAGDQVFQMALTLHANHGSVFFGQGDVLARVRRHGCEPGLAAENVAAMPAATDAPGVAAALVAAWLDSPGHRANLLSREFNYLGCAARLARMPDGRMFVFGAQVFTAVQTEGVRTAGLALR